MDLRQLHLHGALGAARTELWNGREHFVLPVVALMEGVIHAVNADTPEFVTAAALADAVDRWNGHPLVVGHPTRNGAHVSAHDEAVLAERGFGHIRSAYLKNGTRLGMEALVDPARLESLGQQQLLADLRAGKPIEVSVGAFVRANDKAGVHNGKPYKAEWLEIQPDHLAFLPNGRGACSLEMGCGSGRFAHLVTAEGLEEVIMDTQVTKKTLKDRILALFDTPEQATSEEVVEAIDDLRTAAGARNSSADLAMIQTVHDHAASLGATCDRENVKWMAAMSGKECEACGGLGQTKVDGKQSDCAACGGTGTLKAAACGCKETDMTEQEAKALEAENAALKATAEKAAIDLKATVEKTAADLKAAQDKATETEAKLKAASEHVPSEEEWLKTAPPAFRAMHAKQQAVDVAEHAALVTKLKTASTVLTEEQLKTKSLDDLRTLAAFAKVDVTVDYSGRGVAVPRTAETKSYAPPNPYDAELKALAGAKAVN